MGIMIDVMIADDHPAFREGIRPRLDRQQDIRIVREASDGPELFALLSENPPPDVLLLDISMPGFEVLRAIPRLRVRYPQMKILIVTAHDDEARIRQLIDAGVDGYLIKDEDMDTYVRAVRDVAAGKKYFSQRTFEVAIDSANSSMPSPRELEILALVAQDVTTDEIARRLLISSSTVNTHIARVFRKLGVNSRAAAVAKVVQLGYITV
jgi:two-component system, NarL family, response regulator NreC